MNLLCKISIFSSHFSVKTEISDAEKFDLRTFLAGERGAILMAMDDNVTSDFMILLFHQCALYVILRQENAQNMTRYYTVEEGKNMEGKRSSKVVGLNYPNFDLKWWNNKSLIPWFNI